MKWRSHNVPLVGAIRSTIVFPALRRAFVTAGSVPVGPDKIKFFEARCLPSGPRYNERPTPVVFVGGEGVRTDMWSENIDFFSARGYSGFALEMPYSDSDFSTVGTLVRHVQGRIAGAGLMPPVVVAHSLSSFVAQKLLESFPLAALVLVNPVANDPREGAEALLRRWDQCSQQQAESDGLRRSAMSCYYSSCPEETTSAHSMSPQEGGNSRHSALINRDLAQSLSGDPKVAVRLEPGCVPMLAVVSGGDLRTGVLTRESLAALAACHDMRTEDVWELPGDASRLSMRWSGADCGASSESFNDVVFRWVEDNT